ncbi:MAG TPA: hypothetical protein VN628_19705 [Vicinamibacterales bacterium]|nr:hypothetical protein [Vicinamibacterales bacterium]
MLVVGAILWIRARLPRISARIATLVYLDLDEPWSRENAPTVTTFLPSSDIRAIIGGRGEGVDCSIPRLAESAMFDKGTGADVALAFRQSCVFHDFCYRHGHATYGYTKTDCDVLLQEYAYRLCRQGYGDPDPGQEACRERARVILLGVTLFGAENFAHGHNSTYFEFDAFPFRADDYVTARLVRENSASAVPGTSLMEFSRLWWFSFKDGWMTIRSRAAGAAQNASATLPFLREKVPVPPAVVRGGHGDRFTWIARRSLANSGITIFGAEARSPEAVADVLRPHMGDTPSENTGCGLKDSAWTGDFARLEFDCSSSLTKVVALECPDGTTRSLVLTAGHMATRYTTQRAKTEALCADTAHDLLLAPTQLKAAPLRQNTYWFAQDDLIAGHFTAASPWDVVVFGRGHHGDADSGTLTGADYRNSTMVKLWSVDSANEPAPQVVAIPQRFEPLAPFRADGDAVDRLLSIHSTCSEHEQCNLEATEWQPQNHWDAVTSALPITHDWLRQPAQVLQSRAGDGGDRLILSRVLSGRKTASMNDPAFVPDLVRLEYQSLRRAPGGWRSKGPQCVEVDLSAQLKANEDTALVRRYLPDGFQSAPFCVSDTAEAIERRERDSAGRTLNERTAVMSCRELRRDAAARWHRSQVIPGYVFSDGKRQDDALDVIFVFNGFPGQSVRIRDGAAVGTAWARPCGEVR